MIRFKDFAPQIKKKGFFKTDFQTFEQALAAANEWVAGNRIDVINIETVVLPEMWREGGTTDTHLTTSAEMMSSWHQFIRVWYNSN
ncbi:MAG: hypothetical protein ACYSWO_13070 [Planctomycetota bacterium]|jgi:hypothetical protein